MTELTQEELAGYEAKCLELAKKYNVLKVYPYVGIDPNTDERVVGYLKEPGYVQKLYAMDKIASIGPFMAGEELRDALTLKEESDERTYSEMPIYDEFKIGMATECITLIKAIQNSFKKK